MRVLLTGASGFVGTGVLAESLASPRVTEVVSLGRKPSQTKHPKLTELVTPDFGDLSPVAQAFTNFDACFWCLGVQSTGMSEADYSRVTYDYTMNAAKLLLDRNERTSFCFVSGSGADGSAMWARVKKRTEQALVALDRLNVSVFRPAFIRGDHGAQLRGRLYRMTYAVMSPLSPVIRGLGGGTSNSEIGRAMIVAASRPMEGKILDSKAINALAKELSA